MKISVIVPYEGYYQYLKDCLESLSEQENVEIEKPNLDFIPLEYFLTG